MTSFWNMNDLTQPPANTCRVRIMLNDIQKLRTTLTKATNVLKGLNQLDMEAALLSRTIYRLKTKFRHDKGFQTLAKINRALLQYLRLNLLSVFEKFTSMMPPGKSQAGDETSMPTRQLLHWVLIRTLGFACLFCRVAITCEASAPFWIGRLIKNNSSDNALIALGIISRVWAFARYLVSNACAWYADLLPHVDILKVYGINWLPRGQSLPEDLKAWLNAPSVTSVKPPRPDRDSLSVFDWIKYKKEMGFEPEDEEVVGKEGVVTDYGEAISREEEMEHVMPKKKKRRKEMDCGEAVWREEIGEPKKMKEMEELTPKKKKKKSRVNVL